MRERERERERERKKERKSETGLCFRSSPKLCDYEGAVWALRLQDVEF